jgi:hypothetical protein
MGDQVLKPGLNGLALTEMGELSELLEELRRADVGDLECNECGSSIEPMRDRPSLSHRIASLSGRVRDLYLRALREEAR